MHSTPWIHNAAHPDTSSLERFLAHERFRGLQGEALAIALWRYTVDPVVGFYHFWSPSDRDIERACIKLDYVKDPLKLINSYGHMLCGTVATVHVNLCEAAGMPARVVGVTGHTVNEVFFDGAWHLFDCDMRGYYRKRDGAHAIASLRECLQDATLISHPVEKIEPYGLPDRAPEGIAEGCYAPGVGDEMPRFIQRFHAMDYLLRPGERLTRYAAPMGRWHLPPHWIAEGKRFTQELQASGPRERFPPHRTYCNGVFEYAPDLTTQSRDLELGAWSLDHAGATAAGLAVRDAAQGAGRAVFLLQSPWSITGKPDDPRDALQKSAGALAELSVAVPSGQAGSAALLLSLDGSNWEELLRLEQTQSAQVDYTRLVDRRHRALLAVEVRGAAVVTRFATTTWFQLAHNSYPCLAKQGVTVFRYHGGDAAGGRSLTEPWVADLEGAESSFLRDIVSSSNLIRGATPTVRLSPEQPGRPWQAVFRVAPRVLAPRPMVRARLWASIASVPGNPAAPAPDYLARKPRALLEAGPSAHGPWTRVAEAEIPIHASGFHFNLDGEYVLEGAGAPELFLRVTSALPGWEVRAALACSLPEGARGVAPPPLEIVHQWKADGQEREHREVLRDSSVAFEYTVPAGGGGIADTAVIFQVASTKKC